MAPARSRCTSAILLLALTGCGGALPEPTAADAARITARWPGTTLGKLSEGRVLYLKRCGNCHAPYAPEERDEKGWRVSLAEMRERANVAPAQEELILQYLVAVGSAGTAHDP